MLEYLVGQDDECNMLTVGSWYGILPHRDNMTSYYGRYAMTGYGVAFPKQSKWLPLFNEALMSYREHGDLERLHRSEHGT